ncbi:hypothetical protein SKAU_G00252670 [Synaphobranchus kaupii]|uniref:Uncharacterized protein n=1 Tax=Synaphobranchus kaupii TaxID=118154 RepID=A0A9Q1IS22_SYNKA|nr:hypothetical protein SKAU_G00252670 [Synaphobranchus kaupii]
MVSSVDKGSENGRRPLCRTESCLYQQIGMRPWEELKKHDTEPSPGDTNIERDGVANVALSLLFCPTH